MSIVKFYLNDPNAPKTTMPAHLGVNAIITCGDKLLLEKRRDCDIWGLVGGGVKKHETEQQAMIREIKEELGLRIHKNALKKLSVYGEPGRIAAYRDGSVWRMVIVLYELKLNQIPELICSEESRQLRFLQRKNYKILRLLSRTKILWMIGL